MVWKVVFFEIATAYTAYIGNAEKCTGQKLDHNFISTTLETLGIEDPNAVTVLNKIRTNAGVDCDMGIHYGQSSIMNAFIDFFEGME